MTGDGDGLSIGGNHMLHILRRNVNVTVLLFNNRIYGLTKGQYSPTSELGKVTKSTPLGSTDRPVNPLAFALGCGATFVARTVDRDVKHMEEMLKRAALHKGTAFLEILQNCNVYNDLVWNAMYEKESKLQHELRLVHGQPLLFGPPTARKAVIMEGITPRVVPADSVAPEHIWVHDERSLNGARLLAICGCRSSPSRWACSRPTRPPSTRTCCSSRRARRSRSAGAGTWPSCSRRERPGRSGRRAARVGGSDRYMKRLARVGVVLTTLASLAAPMARPGAQQAPPLQAEGAALIPYLDAKPILEQLHASLPADSASTPAAALESVWPTWVSRHDADIRDRLRRGDEDSLVNFLLFGTTFTKRPRSLNDSARIGGRERAAELVRGRMADMVASLASPGANERLVFARQVVERQGIDPATPEGRERTRQFLLELMTRVTGEVGVYARTIQEARAAGRPELAVRSTLYRERGLSSDTSIRPDFAVDRALEAIASKRLLAVGSVRRVAIVGPGLDFTDKADGHDFYPQQITQPFSVANSLLRLRLASMGDLRLTTFDLSPRVNLHLQGARQRANAGGAYDVVVLRERDGGWRPELVGFWRTFGSAIGNAARRAPSPPPGTPVDVRVVPHPAGGDPRPRTPRSQRGAAAAGTAGRRGTIRPRHRDQRAGLLRRLRTVARARQHRGDAEAGRFPALQQRARRAADDTHLLNRPHNRDLFRPSRRSGRRRLVPPTLMSGLFRPGRAGNRPARETRDSSVTTWMTKSSIVPRCAARCRRVQPRLAQAAMFTRLHDGGCFDLYEDVGVEQGGDSEQR